MWSYRTGTGGWTGKAAEKRLGRRWLPYTQRWCPRAALRQSYAPWDNPGMTQAVRQADVQQQVARLQQELQREQSKLQALQDIGQALGSTLDLAPLDLT